MKLKKLRKRVQRLEKRVQEDAAELAKLKRQLEQAEAAKALKAERKSAARDTAGGSTAKRSDTHKPITSKKSKRNSAKIACIATAKPTKIAAVSAALFLLGLRSANS